MPLFLYSNIQFCVDLSDKDSEIIPLGMIAEWCTDEFWKIGICARTRLTPTEVEQLEIVSKEVLENPFGLLYETTHQYLSKVGSRQSEHLLEKYLTQTYPANFSIQATSLFQYTLDVDENPEELFEELCFSVSNPCRRGIWYRIPSQVILLGS